MPSTTAKGAPFPLGTDTADTLDTTIESLAKWVDARPGVSSLTTAQRDALAGTDLWDGRVIWNSTVGRLERYNTGTTSWLLAAVTHDTLVDLNAVGGRPMVRVRLDTDPVGSSRAQINSGGAIAWGEGKLDASGAPVTDIVLHGHLPGGLTTRMLYTNQGMSLGTRVGPVLFVYDNGAGAQSGLGTDMSGNGNELSIFTNPSGIIRFGARDNTGAFHRGAYIITGSNQNPQLQVGGDGRANGGGYITATGQFEGVVAVECTNNAVGQKYVRLTTRNNETYIETLNDAKNAIQVTPFIMENASPSSTLRLTNGGRVRLAAGSTRGLEWPPDAFGGGGDTASISLNQWAAGEAIEVLVHVTNDATDRIRLSSSGGVRFDNGGVPAAQQDLDTIHIAQGTGGYPAGFALGRNGTHFFSGAGTILEGDLNRWGSNGGWLYSSGAQLRWRHATTTNDYYITG